MNLKNILRHLTRRAFYKPLSTLGISLLLTAVLSVFALRIHVNTDLTDLLPTHLPLVNAVKTLQQESGGIGYQMLTVESPSPEANRKFLEQASARIQKLPEVNYVLRRLPTSFFSQHRLLFLELQDLRALHRRFVRKIRYENNSKNPLVVPLIAPKDPGLKFDDIEQKYRRKVGSIQSSYRADQGRFQGLLIRPQKSSNNLTFTKRFLKKIDHILTKLRPKSFHPKMKTELHGTHVEALSEIQSIERDVFQGAWITVLL
ncbi:MAG: hypothetical protein AAGJ35_00575, partial [Myxococcota bacterium]